MAEVVDTAGRAEVAQPAKPTDARREIIQAARSVMRRTDATDDEYDDAIEALIELAKG